MIDVMTSCFPGDPTAKTTKTKLTDVQFSYYADQGLWNDGPAPLATSPRLYVLDDTKSQKETDFDRDEFNHYMTRYWSESTFQYTHGDRAVLELTCFLGQARSAADMTYLQAFRDISMFAIKSEIEALTRFKEARPEFIQFFHVYDGEEAHTLNFHTHNLIFLT